jgi:hypothetical protein
MQLSQMQTPIFGVKDLVPPFANIYNGFGSTLFDNEGVFAIQY